MPLSRYNSSPGTDEYQPGSRHRVLRNRMGITHKREMDRLEAEALAVAQNASFDTITAQTRFTAPLLCSMHRDWLGDIYEWAGEYRAVELAKGTFRWPPARHVAQNMKTFEQTTLARLTPCSPGSVEDVSLRIAEVHGSSSIRFATAMAVWHAG